MGLTHSGPVVEQLGPVLGVGGGSEDVHHHEVLDVELLAARLVQLVDVVPGRQVLGKPQGIKSGSTLDFC